MNAKNHLLDQVFDEIILRYKKAGLPLSSEIRDGIINKSVFDTQKTKILFIGKEHNQLNDTYDKGDARVWMNQYVNYNFSHRLAEWSHGILNDFTAVEKISEDQKKLALKSIAFINLKKVSGTNLTNPKEHYPYFECSVDLLSEQIKIIEPNLIILFTGWHGYADQLFTKSPDSGDLGSEVYKLDQNRVAINFMHPSARAPKAASYYYLERLLLEYKL